MLEDVYRSILRRWRVFAAVALLAIASATALGVLWPERFTATAAVTVEAVATGQNSVPPVNMETQRVVASSAEVLELAAEELDDLPSVTELRSELQVQVPRDSQVLEFDLTAGSAEVAAERANAIAAAYLEHRLARAEGLIAQASEELKASVDELTAQAAALEPGSPARVSIENQISTLQDRQATLLATSVDAGAFIDPAAAPSEEDGPALYVFVAAGVFLGVFIGAFAALVWDRILAARERHRAAATTGELEAVPFTGVHAATAAADDEPPPSGGRDDGAASAGSEAEPRAAVRPVRGGGQGNRRQGAS